MSDKTVFLIGPGYIGLEVIERLLENEYNVTALVRRDEAASELQEKNVKTVMGTIDDLDIITEQTASHDIVIHTATADHLPSVQAVIKGIEKRASQDKHTIYIHTSGCSFLSDDSRGTYGSETIYSDKDPAALDARPEDSSHREIDLAILAAREKLGTKAKLFIVLPPLIYGASTNGRLSIQVITMARFAIKHKYAGYVGGGKGIWGLIHVKDLSHGYLLVLQFLQNSPDVTALENPYFFCENGKEITWGEIAAFIGQELKSAGKIEDEKPREIPKEQYGDLFGKYSDVVIASNARNRADRLRELGWQPEHFDIHQAFKKEELPILLRETGEFNGYAKPAASGSG